MEKLSTKKLEKFLLRVTILIVLILWLGNAKNVYATDNNILTNATRVYFSSEVTKNYGNGDCILLENYDANGNKIYGLIDAGNKVKKEDADGNSSTVVKEFLKDHGVEKLEFLAITHSHGDHNGDALVVLDNFEIDTIYMKEFDAKWSPTGTQGTYEDIIERAVAKNIKVVGVSFLSLISNEISPSRSTDFMNNTKNAKEELFESFYYNSDEDTNILFNFGSATIQIFNWEMFDEDGNQYITGVTTNTTREIDTNENNNSITFLLKQGNKKAFFAGDMNNLDEDKEKGRIGDEDRLKDFIGKVDFLKLGHHGYIHSNTEDYMHILNPEYAVITNDVGGANKDIVNWLKENNVNYLYTTSDEYGISATIMNNDIYLGFETTGSFINIDRTTYYIPEGNKYQYTDYTKILYNVEYQTREVEVNSWKELKEVIENNKYEIVNLDDTNKICTLYKLIINIKTGGDWTANNTITVEKKQDIVLTTTEQLTVLRGTELKKSELFSVLGSLSIGTENMTGTITIDGNKDNVEAASTLIKIDSGTLNLLRNTTLCNNLNKTTGRTNNSAMQDYTSFGSAIYSKAGIINIYGGDITNNSQDVVYTHTLPKETNNYYRYSSLGAGIYMTTNSILNMYSGTISNNEAQNHSIVKTNSSYTNDRMKRGITQGCSGVGIFANANSEVNLLGGKISNNIAKNYAITTLTTATDNTKKTNIHSLNDGIYGVGIYTEGANLTISNNFIISDNTAELNSKITLEENTSINTSANSGIRGLQGYVHSSSIDIDGAIITNGMSVNNSEITNNGSVGETGTDSVSTLDVGGGLDFISNTTFNVNNLTLDNCHSGNGGGIYIQSSKGTISNSTITNNRASRNGGGIWTYLTNVKFSNVTLSENEAQYGGGIYILGVSSNAEFNNIKVTKNKATVGSGGGIYAYGNLTISGKDTSISDNNANTYGGGIMLKTKGTINAGEISNNSAAKYSGGGVKVDGKLVMNGGTIKGNTANSYGGGVDYTNGTFYFNSGMIENNTAAIAGNEIHPEDNIATDSVNPILAIGEIPNEWTKEDIIVTITASDDETNIKTVTVNGEQLLEKDGIYTYIANKNGTYEVLATDNAGNATKKEFTITYIDKDAPIITGVTNNAIYNEEVIINATDVLSGIKSVKLTKNGLEMPYTLGEKITDSGEYTIVIEDNVSNKSTLTFTIDRSLKEDEIVIAGISNDWTNQDQIITITIHNEIKSIKINEEDVTLTDGTYTIIATMNASYTVEMIDLDGNKIIKTIEVSNIDKNAPTIYGVINENIYEEKINLIIRDEQSGISSITIIKDGEEKNYTENEIEILENGKYQIKVVDNARNETIINFTMKMNEKEVDDTKDEENDDMIKGEDNTQDESTSDGGIQESYEAKESDKTMANVDLPTTGTNKIMVGIIILLISAFICYFKVRSYKDIK